MALRTAITTDGHRLGYDDSGHGGALPALLVHGWMTTHRVWDRLRTMLGDRRLVLPDLRGVGGSSTPPEYTLQALARDVLQVADAAALERFHLVGHSMGGQLVQLVADQAPGRIATLALVNPVPLAGLPLPEQVAASFRAAGGRPHALGGILDAACLRLDPAERARLVELAAAIEPATIAAGLDAWTAGVEVPWNLRITAPTLVIATDDPFLPAALLDDRVVKRIAGAHLRALPGLGHYPQLEAAEMLAPALLELWNE